MHTKIALVISDKYPQVTQGRLYSVQSMNDTFVKMVGINHPIPLSAVSIVDGVELDSIGANKFCYKRYTLVEETVFAENIVGSDELYELAVIDRTKIESYTKGGVQVKNFREALLLDDCKEEVINPQSKEI
jgi:hypothetical protein